MDFVKEWGGLLVGVLSIVVALFIYAASKRRAQLAYRVENLRLIDKADSLLPDEVSILFKGVEVPRLTKTTIVLWNRGNTTISGTEIVEHDPLRTIFPEGTEILSANVIRITRDVIRFNVDDCQLPEPNLYYKFGFLDPGDGATVEVIHTATDVPIEVEGTVKGMSRGVSYLGGGVTNSDNELMWEPLTNIVLLPASLGGCFIAALFNLGLKSWVTYAIVLYCVAVALLVLYALRGRFPGALSIDRGIVFRLLHCFPCSLMSKDTVSHSSASSACIGCLHDSSKSDAPVAVDGTQVKTKSSSEDSAEPRS